MNDITADLARALFRAERAERERDRLIRELMTRDRIDEPAARLKYLGSTK